MEQSKTTSRPDNEQPTNIKSSQTKTTMSKSKSPQKGSTNLYEEMMSMGEEIELRAITKRMEARKAAQVEKKSTKQ